MESHGTSWKNKLRKLHHLYSRNSELSDVTDLSVQVLTDYKVDAGTTSPNDFAIMVKAGLWEGTETGGA